MSEAFLATSELEGIGLNHIRYSDLRFSITALVGRSRNRNLIVGRSIASEGFESGRPSLVYMDWLRSIRLLSTAMKIKSQACPTNFRQQGSPDYIKSSGAVVCPFHEKHYRAACPRGFQGTEVQSPVQKMRRVDEQCATAFEGGEAKGTHATPCKACRFSA